MNTRYALCFSILFSILITIALTGCNRVATVEFEGLTISTNDSFRLIAGEEHIKDKWSFSEKKELLDVIQRMTPREDDQKMVLGLGPQLFIEAENHSFVIRINGVNIYVYVTKGETSEEVKLYKSSPEDVLTTIRHVIAKELYDEMSRALSDS